MAFEHLHAGSHFVCEDFEIPSLRDPVGREGVAKVLGAPVESLWTVNLAKPGRKGVGSLIKRRHGLIGVCKAPKQEFL